MPYPGLRDPRLRVLAAACALVLAGPAQAQDLIFSPAGTEACIAEAPGAEASCIGASAQACMLDTPGGSSTVVTGGCLERERLYWDARLNAAYRARMAEARAADADARAQGYRAPPQEDALREMQRAWIAFRDARCTWAASLWGGGTGGGPAAIGCAMQLTGEQALYLEHTVR